MLRLLAEDSMAGGGACWVAICLMWVIPCVGGTYYVVAWESLESLGPTGRPFSCKWPTSFLGLTRCVSLSSPGIYG